MNFTVTSTELQSGTREIMGRVEHYSEIRESVHGVRTQAHAMAEFDTLSQVIDIDNERYGSSRILSVTVTNRKGEILAAKAA